MSDSLPIIIVDDDPAVCEIIFETVKKFYTWGEVFSFTDSLEVLSFCRRQKTGFDFLDSILDKYPVANQDTIIITGNASDDVVDMCIASDITYLLEKPIRPYALQLAIRAIVSKYMKFAKKLMKDPQFAESILRF